MHRRIHVLLGLAIVLGTCAGAGEAGEVRIPASAHNLLVEAKVSGNLASYKKGLRGEPHHVIYDLQARRFVESSQHHEYGVGFQQDLGVVSERDPAYWMAEWKVPVRVNLLVLSGVYPNQPQPETCWKIELRRDGKWREHARGKGGWYDRGRYVWGGAGTEPVEVDALRVSVFSKDAASPIGASTSGARRVSPGWWRTCRPSTLAFRSHSDECAQGRPSG